LGKRGFFLKLSPERLVHLALQQDPIFFKKEMGVFDFGAYDKSRIIRNSWKDEGE